MKKVQANDSFQRINYLYQISKHIVKSNPALSSYYGNLMVNVAKKNVLKMHPDIKRQICKKCRCILIHGQTSTMRIKTKKKQKTVVWTCHTCKSKKYFPVEKGKEPLWLCLDHTYRDSGRDSALGPVTHMTNGRDRALSRPLSRYV